MKTITALIPIVILVALAVIIILRITLVETGSKPAVRDGYIRVESVPGVAFEVNKNLADYATAVLAVTKDVDFVKNASYTYKNGTDTYMLFNMSQYIVVAKKGTSFNLANNDVKTSLETNSLAGIWFEHGTNLSKSEGKCSVDVEAQVVITNTIYNDFKGRLVTVTEDGDEWALFVGAVNAADSSMEDMIKYVASSFTIDNEVIGDDENVFEIAVDEKPKLVPVTTVAAEETKTEFNTVEAEEQEVESSANKEPDSATVQPEPEPTPEPEAVQEETPAEVIEVPEEQIVTGEYNQKQAEYKEETEETAYTSSVYSMLGRGKIGYMTCTNQMLGSYDEIFVRADSFNDESRTKQLIEEYIKSGDAYYTEMEAPLGTHWESVTYSVKFPDEYDYYVNCSFVGMDGQKLKYRGISYSSKSYDILNKITKNDDGWRVNYTSFFAVPNGCEEYAVAFGDEVAGHGYKAYYKVVR